MQYLASFSSVQGWLQQHATAESGALDLRYDSLQDLIRHILVAVPVDEDWYREVYAGMGESIAAGMFQNAAQHFVTHGYFEGRAPFAADSGRVSPPPFPALAATLNVRPRHGTLYVDMTFDDLRALLRRVVAAVPVDAEWYCARYPHVAQAIASGQIASAADHFASVGYFESLWPFRMPVDSEWYFSRYPDARAEVDRGIGRTAEEHFVQRGYGQTRLPVRSWIGLLWDKSFSY